MNSYPFIYGLRNHAVLNEIDLELDNPADCARKLLNGEADLGLIPVAVIPQLHDPIIVSNKCIGADGAVESVCLFSEVPLNEIDEVLLDHQSRTSVQLVRILAERYWHLTPRWVNGEKDFISKIKGGTAGVVIGDRAFELRKRFPVVMDLSHEWKLLTGLPFVFACWVSNKPLPEQFIARFQEALTFGLANRDKAVLEMAGSDVEAMTRYVNDIISYELDGKKMEAMKLFHRWSGNATVPHSASFQHNRET